MHPVQDSVERTLSKANGTWSAIIKRYKEGTIASLKPGEPYEMASEGKVGLVSASEKKIARGELSWEEPLAVEARHKPSRNWKKLGLRPGTGPLKDVRSGLDFSFDELFELMLVESDTTAASVILERLGGRSEVNRQLKEELGVEQTGLASGGPDDYKFMSEVATPADMMLLWENLIEYSSKALELLRRSHFTSGLRQFENLPSADNYRNLRPRAIANSLLHKDEEQRQLLRRVMARQPSSLASKEGILPLYEGKSYLHEMAVYNLGSSPLLLVAVFSKGTPGEGYTIEYAQGILGRLGSRINGYNR